MSTQVSWNVEGTPNPPLKPAMERIALQVVKKTSWEEVIIMSTIKTTSGGMLKPAHFKVGLKLGGQFHYRLIEVEHRNPVGERWPYQTKANFRPANYDYDTLEPIKIPSTPGLANQRGTDHVDNVVDNDAVEGASSEAHPAPVIAVQVPLPARSSGVSMPSSSLTVSLPVLSSTEETTQFEVEKVVPVGLSLEAGKLAERTTHRLQGSSSNQGSSSVQENKVQVPHEHAEAPSNEGEAGDSQAPENETMHTKPMAPAEVAEEVRRRDHAWEHVPQESQRSRKL